MTEAINYCGSTLVYNLTAYIQLMPITPVSYTHLGKDMWIRRVLVPNLTNDDKELNNLYDFISSLKTVKKVEILPYHTLGLFKWENLGIDYPLKDYKTPTKEEVEKAEKILHIEK